MTSTQSNQIVDGTTFTSEDYTVGEVVANAGGKGKSGRITNVGSKRPLYLQTPLMLTWGANMNQWDDNSKPVYDMSLQFPRDDFVTEESTAFLEQMKAYEANLKTLAIENSKTWLSKKTITPDALDALWQPMLKYPKGEDEEPDYSRPPTLRLKIPVWDDVFKCEVYDVNGDPLFTPDLDEEECKGDPMSLIKKGCMVSAIIQSGGIYNVGGKIGTTWKLFQVIVKPKPSLYGKCHISLSGAQRATLEASNVSDEDVREEVEDSDEEEEVEEDVSSEVAAEVAEVVSAAAPKKKVVRRKKKVVAADEDV